MIQKKMQAFKDGIVRIYSVSDGARAGDMPIERARCRAALRFAERTVGNNRFWSAKQNGVTVSRVIRCPLREEVSPQDLAQIGRACYEVVQVQRPEGQYPPVMDLTLERVEAVYGPE